MSKVIGDKTVFAVEYSFIDDKETELYIYHENINILEFTRKENTFTTRWNLDSISSWLRDFLDNMCEDPYPVDTDGEYVAQKDISAREFDSDDDEEFDAYYDKLDEWNQRHRWHYASDGAIIADVYFQLVGNKVELSWNNNDLYDGVIFSSVMGGCSIDKDTFVNVVEEFLKDYAERGL